MQVDMSVSQLMERNSELETMVSDLKAQLAAKGEECVAMMKTLSDKYEALLAAAATPSKKTKKLVKRTETIVNESNTKLVKGLYDLAEKQKNYNRTNYAKAADTIATSVLPVTGANCTSLNGIGEAIQKVICDILGVDVASAKSACTLSCKCDDNLKLVEYLFALGGANKTLARTIAAFSTKLTSDDKFYTKGSADKIPGLGKAAQKSVKAYEATL